MDAKKNILYKEIAFPIYQFLKSRYYIVFKILFLYCLKLLLLCSKPSLQIRYVVDIKKMQIKLGKNLDLNL